MLSPFSRIAPTLAMFANWLHKNRFRECPTTMKTAPWRLFPMQRSKIRFRRRFRLTFPPFQRPSARSAATTPTRSAPSPPTPNSNAAAPHGIACGRTLGPLFESPASHPSLEGAQQAGMNPLFLPDILCRMLEEGLRLQFGSLPKHLSAQAALPDELDELGSLDHNPKRHPPPRPASTNNSTKRPKIVPAQRSILIVVSGQVSLSVDTFGMWWKRSISASC